MAIGFIKIFRAITENKIWGDKPFSKGQAWIDLIMLAAWDDGSELVGNTDIEVKRGQIFTSILSLSERWGWSRKKISSFFDYLEKSLMIVQKRNTKFTLITICKYDDYQLQENKIEHQKNNKRTSTEHQKNTLKNIEEIKEDKEVIKPIGFISTEAQRISFEKFNLWIKSEVPEIAKMSKPFTISQYVTLIGEMPDKKSKTGFKPGIPKSEVIAYLQAIENNKEYLKKYRSPYLCILAWHKRPKK